MKQNGNKSGVIIGIPALAEFLGVSIPTTYKYLKMGLPGQKIEGIWFFHKDNIEDFWRIITRKKPIISDNEIERINDEPD